MENEEYLTQEKFDELSKELDFLKKVKRREIAESLEYARSLGDLSENAEYQEARADQANVEDRIIKLESLLKTAKIISSPDKNEVGVGSIVTVQKEKASGSQIYTIVGSEESDTSSGKISIKSPLGQAVLGKKKGELFSFKTPGGTVKYKVLSIK